MDLYLYRKIDRLKGSVQSHSINIDKAYRNYKKANSQDQRTSSNNVIILELMSQVERRRILEYQNEHDSLDKSKGYALEIER